MYTVQDVIQFVEDENVTFIRLAYFDVFGRQKNISILPSELSRAFKEGISFDASAICGFGDEVKSDLFLIPDPTTLTLLPWRSVDGAVILMFCDIQYPDGTLFECDTRNLLKKQVLKAKEKGLTFYFGSEFEFYLFQCDEKGRTTKEPLDQAGYMDIGPEDCGEDVRKDICLTLSEMGLFPETSHHEEGPGQNEIDIRYATAAKAADECATLRWVIKTTAKSYGLTADFHPKPIKDKPGSGMHVNVSVKSSDGKQYLDKVLAGVLKYLPDMTAFMNPCEESYERLGKNKAPRYVTWSKENRSQAIRIPAVKSNAQRLEIRSPDCMSNPYLVYALVIEAGIRGIEENLVPCESVDVNLYYANSEVTKDLIKLPNNLEEARMVARNSEMIQELVPKSILDVYL